MRTFHHHSTVRSAFKPSHHLQPPPTPSHLLSSHSTWLPMSVKRHSSLPARKEVSHKADEESELPPSPRSKKEQPLECQQRLNRELDIYSHLVVSTFLCVRGSQLKQSLNKIQHFINIVLHCSRFNRKYLVILRNRKITTKWGEKRCQHQNDREVYLIKILKQP